MPTTVVMRVMGRLRLSAVFFLVLGMAPSVAGAEDLRLYLPLESGNWWSYSENGSPATLTILPGTVTLSYGPTKVMRDSDGYERYLTNDDSGIRNHRERAPSVYIEGLGTREAIVTFSPPYIYTLPTMPIGDWLVSEGTATLQVSALGSFSINYTAMSSVRESEKVSVPLGTFKTYRLELSLRLYGSVGGQPLDMTLYTKYWMAKDVGLVKYEDSYIGAGLLTDTSISIADLVIEKADARDPAVKGKELTYTVTVTNQGPDAATGVVLTDTLPPGVDFVSASDGCTEADGTVTCTLGSLTSGESTPVSIAVSPSETGTITNTAGVSANEADPDPDNNSVTESTGIRTGALPFLPLLLDP